jgi:NAD(P) transhydrogenase subunit alpha
MAPGSVIVDMAASNGGNCAMTEPGKTVVKNGVTIVGETNLTSDMPVHASQLYARTLLAMLEEFTDENGFAPKPDDEIFAGSCVTDGGRIVHDRVAALLS